jgi:prephenate dehydrogenase
MEKFYLEQLTIIGVGLIGGSVASRLKRNSSVGKVVGVGRSQKNMAYALEADLIDEVATDIRLAVANASMVLVAVPVKQVESVLHEIKLSTNAHVIITDVGSTKGDFTRMVEKVIPERAEFVVPGHPIAGSEKAGAPAADENLFVGKNVVLCPLSQTRASALSAVREMWQSCGAHVSTMSEDKHVVSYALVEMMNRRADSAELFDFAAGGFRDFSRIAGSSSEMWVDICRANNEHIVKDVESFIASLETIRELLKSGNYGALQRIFAAAAVARNNWASKQ